MKIRFDKRYRKEVESGKYKVMNGEGRPVRIVCWDKKSSTDLPIVGLVYDKSRDEEYVMTFDKNGSNYNDKGDLWIETGADFMAEFDLLVQDFCRNIEDILTKAKNE